jgi:hypothetical protein
MGSKVDLIVEITNMLQPDLAEARRRFCERCQNLDEIVVAILKIPALNKTLAVCGHCMQEVPRGFQVT